MEIDNYIRKIMASDDENKKEQFIIAGICLLIMNYSILIKDYFPLNKKD